MPPKTHMEQTYKGNCGPITGRIGANIDKGPQFRIWDHLRTDKGHVRAYMYMRPISGTAYPEENSARKKACSWGDNGPGAGWVDLGPSAGRSGAKLQANSGPKFQILTTSYDRANHNF